MSALPRSLNHEKKTLRPKLLNHENFESCLVFCENALEYELGQSVMQKIKRTILEAVLHASDPGTLPRCVAVVLVSR